MTTRVDVLQQGQRTATCCILPRTALPPDNPYFSALKLADGWIDVRILLPAAAAERGSSCSAR